MTETAGVMLAVVDHWRLTALYLVVVIAALIVLAVLR